MRSDVEPRWPERKPLAFGLAVFGLLVSVFALQELFLERFRLIQSEPSLLREIRIAIVHCLLAGYLPGAFFFLLRSERETKAELWEALDLDTDPSEGGSTVHLWRVERTLLGFAGMLLTTLIPYLTAQDPWNIAAWIPEVMWHRILGLWIGWWLGWLAYEIWRTSSRVSNLADRIDSIDLLDLSPWSPFTRHGVRTALLPIGGVSLALLFLLEPDQWPAVIIVIALCLPLASLGLWLPVRGVHRRIREVRQAELVWARERIQHLSHQIHRASSDTASGQIADLSAYLRLIEDVPEWPIEGSVVAQVLLYLLLPVASWIGSLLIENILGVLF